MSKLCPICGLPMREDEARSVSESKGQRMKKFKATTTIPGMPEPFVDWYEAETIEQAKEAYDADALIHLSARARAESTVTIEEVR